MRMWLVNPKFMCRQHLLGEHVECHMFQGCIEKGHNLKGFRVKNLLAENLLKVRHDELVVEMEFRGYNHKTPLREHQGIGTIDSQKSEIELMQRCELCRNRKKDIQNVKL